MNHTIGRIPLMGDGPIVRHHIYTGHHTHTHEEKAGIHHVPRGIRIHSPTETVRALNRAATVIGPSHFYSIKQLKELLPYSNLCV